MVTLLNLRSPDLIGGRGARTVALHVYACNSQEGGCVVVRCMVVVHGGDAHVVEGGWTERGIALTPTVYHAR
jgi:hypothetical protein